MASAHDFPGLMVATRLDAAVADYISLGAPAPESARGGGDGLDTMSAEDALVSAAVTAADEDASR